MSDVNHEPENEAAESPVEAATFSGAEGPVDENDSVYEDDKTYTVRFKRRTEAMGAVWRSCGANGKPLEYQMKGRAVNQLREHLAYVH